MLLHEAYFVNPLLLLLYVLITVSHHLLLADDTYVYRTLAQLLS